MYGGSNKGLEITNIPGYLPVENNKKLKHIRKDNAVILLGMENVLSDGALKAKESLAYFQPNLSKEEYPDLSIASLSPIHTFWSYQHIGQCTFVIYHSPGQQLLGILQYYYSICRIFRQIIQFLRVFFQIE